MRLCSRSLNELFKRVSIHAPREGCDYVFFTASDVDKFQFTHPGRGATQDKRQHYQQEQEVSIHAPREGCDYLLPSFHIRSAVSIHAPREGCDTPLHIAYQDPDLFQFTHPGRGATPLTLTIITIMEQFQFTHPGRGATPSSSWTRRIHFSFNSRTPGGVRLLEVGLIISISLFQFTHPGRGATQLRTSL